MAKRIPEEIRTRLMDSTPLSEMEMWNFLKAAGSRRVFLQWAMTIQDEAKALQGQAAALKSGGA